MSYRILTINPGSTSTKVGCFNGEELEFSVNVSHDAAKLAEFATISDQLPYRKEIILAELEKAGVDLSTVDAYVGRGGDHCSAGNRIGARRLGRRGQRNG